MIQSSPPRATSVRVFENDFLERLTHVHPVIPLLVWGPIIILAYVYSLGTLSLQLPKVIWLSIGGMLTWTFIEYVLHRFLFHFDAQGKLGRRVVFLFHGIHHDDPHDPSRLVMPPVPGLLLGAVFFALFRIAWGPLWVYPFFAGYITGYLIYDYIHLAIHHAQPRTSVGKFLKRYNYLHHFKEPHAKWGVSSPLWDYVFQSHRTLE